MTLTNVFTVACVDTRILAGHLHSMISGFLQRGSDLGLGRSFCNFARDGRGVRSDSGTCWDTFLETGIQVGLSSELVLLRQVDQRLRSAYWCYDHLLQNRGDAWSRIFHWHTLRAGFVRAVAYLAERCAVTKIMKDVPGFVVTTSMLGKLLGGESREIPCRTERDFGSCVNGPGGCARVPAR